MVSLGTADPQEPPPLAVQKRQKEEPQPQHGEKGKEGQKRRRAAPLWLIVLVTTCVAVFVPVLVGLLLIASNSNARLAATQLRSVAANASGLAQLVVERIIAAESAAHYISSFVRFSNEPLVHGSSHFYHTLAQALVSFDAFVKRHTTVKIEQTDFNLTSNTNTKQLNNDMLHGRAEPPVWIDVGHGGTGGLQLLCEQREHGDDVPRALRPRL